MSWIKTSLRTLGYVFYLLVACFIVLEIVFRVLPTSSSFQLSEVSSSNPIPRFPPNKEFTYQIGFDFQHVVKKQTNDAGYFSDDDYLAPKPHSHKVALIGDSYVEALQVTNAESLGGRLANARPDLLVYTVGVSGSPLSQYLAFAGWVEENFAPDGYVFVIVGNDFDEFSLRYKSAPGFHYYDEDHELTRVDYSPSFIKRVARRSALVRYLYTDLKLQVQIERMLSGRQEDEDVSRDENFGAALDPAKWDITEDVIDAFIADLKSLTGDKPVLFVLDGDRHGIYTDAAETWGEYQEKAFAYFRERCCRSGAFRVLDLEPIFERIYRETGKKFEFPIDWHWNAFGHETAVRAILESGFLDAVSAPE